MSGLHLYCVVPAGLEPDAQLRGVDAAPVRAELADGVGVWVSEHTRRPEAALDHLREHHAVVGAAAHAVSPLPIRFGEWVPGREALLDRLGRSRDQIDAGLAAVAGTVEFGVRIVEPARRRDDEAASGTGEGRATSGRAFMRGLARDHDGLRRRLTRREAVVAALRTAVEGVARAERVFRVDAPALVSVAHMVARSDEEAYRSALDAFERAHRGFEVHLVGPWPPWSFAP